MKKITESLVSELSGQAKKAERQRYNYNFHGDYSDPINRMINAVEKDAYFPPHKHENPDKREIFIILKGRVLVIEFDGKGKIKDHIVLDPNEGNFGVEIPAKKWHSLIPLEEQSVLYEIKDGPYDKKEDKIFAGWAPEETSEDAQKFVLGVLQQLNISPS